MVSYVNNLRKNTYQTWQKRTVHTYNVRELYLPP